ncbi:MAG: FG-GAP repeat protein, partial [Candidatus Bipolaricaulia bacterium]
MGPASRRLSLWSKIVKLGLLIAIISLWGGFSPSLGQLSKTIDIANGEQNATIFGADNNDFSNPFLDGFDSLAVGDINGDGIDDLIIGAPSADGPENRRVHCGEVYVIFGPPPA